MFFLQTFPRGQISSISKSHTYIYIYIIYIYIYIYTYTYTYTSYVYIYIYIDRPNPMAFPRVFLWFFRTQEMMEKFKKYDVDNDGKISKKELITWVFGPNGEDEKAWLGDHA